MSAAWIVGFVLWGMAWGFLMGYATAKLRERGII